MSWRPLTTSENFSKVSRLQLDSSSTLSYAFSYLALLQCNLVEDPIVDIWDDLDTLRFLQHGEYPPQVTLSQHDHI
jgi:hypothetical protein